VTTPDRPAELVVHRIAAELGLRTTMHASPHDLDGACSVALAALSGDDRPTAFFCLADSMAYGVYAAARELGVRVPHDVSVLGYDDNELSRLLDPPLSTYRWPVDALVRAVVERTVQAIETGKHARRKVLTPTAQPRASVAPPPSA
jgi:LacI family transcriptional regulator